MLTYPSDSDAIPPNPFCSVPPQSEPPPPPLLPLPSFTPRSQEDERKSGTRRSGRIQGFKEQNPKKQSHKDRVASERSFRQTPSSTKQERESGMVQLSQSLSVNLLRVDYAHLQRVKQNEDTLDAEDNSDCPTKHQTGGGVDANLSTKENVEKRHVGNTAQGLDAPSSDMDRCGELAVETAPKQTGWVIGPLFQSLKSKMASFTEIVMTPVKLFKANSSLLASDNTDELKQCKLQAHNRASDSQSSETSRTFLAHGQAKNDDKMEADPSDKHISCFTLSSRQLGVNDQLVTCSPQQGGTDLGSGENLRRTSIKDSQNITFVADSSPHGCAVDECASTEKETDTHYSLQRRPLPSSASEKVSKSMASFHRSTSDSPCLPAVCNTDSILFPRKSLRKASKGVAFHEGVLKAPANKAQSEAKPDCVEGLGMRIERAKRRLNLSLKTDTEAVLMKRKKGMADECTEHEISRDNLNVWPGNSIPGGLKVPRNRIDKMDTVQDMEMKLSATETKINVYKDTKSKLTGGQNRVNRQNQFVKVNEAMSLTHAENASSAIAASSMDHNNGVSEISQKNNNRRKTSGSNKMSKKRTNSSPCEANGNVQNVEMETTMATTFTKESQHKRFSGVPDQPMQVQLCSSQPTSEFPHSSHYMNTTVKPLKRKSLKQKGLISEPGSTLDLKVEGVRIGPKHSSKRLKKDSRVSVKSELGVKQFTEPSMDNSTTYDTVKEVQSKVGDKTSMESMSMHYEMTPTKCSVKVYKYNLKDRIDIQEMSTKSLTGEILLTDGEATNQSQIKVIEEVKEEDGRVDAFTDGADINTSASERSHNARGVKNKRRRAANQRRKCRVVFNKRNEDEEETNTIAGQELDLAVGTCPSEKNFSSGLLRSYSCPDMPSVIHHDTPWSPTIHWSEHGKIYTSHQHQSPSIPPILHAHKSARRTRRHTVCSVEIEREIAPLCLRKEVYPSRRRSAPCGTIAHHLSAIGPLSPSASLSDLASCFLSSPLAFLSKKFENRVVATSSNAQNHVSAPSSASVFTASTSSPSSSTWHLFPSRADTSAADVSSVSSSLAQIPLECETRQQSGEDEYGEDTSSSSQEFEELTLREEKSFSDSEIKVVKKHEERGKVSSIRIRRGLPKPQNNLTPMGLPKAIRLKKKDFSLEEIYTNQNFAMPPESRLETIFELPHSRRNGSQSVFGQKRIKRSVEFPEVGVPRKPKKPVVSGPWKAGSTSSLGRPRRSNYNNSKDEPSISMQELDSLLCTKLDQLDLWVTLDEDSS